MDIEKDFLELRKLAEGLKKKGFPVWIGPECIVLSFTDGAFGASSEDILISKDGVKLVRSLGPKEAREVVRAWIFNHIVSAAAALGRNQYDPGSGSGSRRVDC